MEAPPTADPIAQANRLFVRAVQLVQRGSDLPARSRIGPRADAKGLLTSIVNGFPETELAVKLVTNQPVGGFLASEFQEQYRALFDEVCRSDPAPGCLGPLASELAALQRGAEVARDPARLVLLEAENETLRRTNEAMRTAVAAAEAEHDNLRAALDKALREAARLKADLASEPGRSAEAMEEAAIRDRQIMDLRNQLASLSAALEASETEREEQDAAVVDLGRKLNQALAVRVEELSRSRSAFLATVGKVLADDDDVIVKGDRLVIRSELLFDPGVEHLTSQAEERLAAIADILVGIASRIPHDTPWVLQVDGHADINEGTASNFESLLELSASRAFSVIEFLIEQGVTPDRLALAAFSAFHPADRRENEGAYRANRRVELKLTPP